MTIDRRISKTKEAIRKALINLLDNNEIENISVTEIAREADITRKTFYTYYDSYEKLIDELENDLIEMFEKPINKMEFSESAFNPQLIFETLTDLVRENLEFYQHFMVGNNHNFLAKIAKKLKEIIKRNKTMFADLDEIDKDMIIDYTIAGIIAVYQTWFRNNQNVSIDEISVKLSELSANGFNYFIKG